jgi:hypothetical protein
MRTTAVMLLAAIAGCSGAEGSDGTWTHASAALAAHGVAEYRAQTSATGQQVLLRDGDQQTIGELSLVQSDASTTVTLDFRAETWKQLVVAASGEMTLSLDGRQATLRWDGSAWSGDAAAEALLADSQPYADFVRLVGVEAKLGRTTTTPPSPASPAPTPASPGDLGATRPPPKLCCGDAVTTASGWAWYWEEHAEVTACKRANDALKAACELSSGYDCCNTRASGCTACIDWGTGYACSTAAYLQYAIDPATTCK